MAALRQRGVLKAQIDLVLERRKSYKIFLYHEENCFLTSNSIAFLNLYAKICKLQTGVLNIRYCYSIKVRI